MTLEGIDMAPDSRKPCHTYQYQSGSVIFRTSPVGALSGLVR